MKEFCCDHEGTPHETNEFLHGHRRVRPSYSQLTTNGRAAYWKRACHRETAVKLCQLHSAVPRFRSLCCAPPNLGEACPVPKLPGSKQQTLLWTKSCSYAPQGEAPQGSMSAVQTARLIHDRHDVLRVLCQCTVTSVPVLRPSFPLPERHGHIISNLAEPNERFGAAPVFCSPSTSPVPASKSS